MATNTEHSLIEPLLALEELAAILNIPVGIIRNLRAAGQAPRAVKIGGSQPWWPSIVSRIWRSPSRTRDPLDIVDATPEEAERAAAKTRRQWQATVDALADR
ncbi:MAG: hypothetical protein ACFWTS_00835 [Pseudoclavibacter caeni]|jgi:hypothetical protein